MYYSLISSMNKGVGYTSRTTAFASATGITDLTILNALSTFDAGLISNGLDTKMKALYPFVGNTATTQKYNFMDARDLDVAFRLQFNGGWTFSSTGALPNGTNAYADTKLNANTMIANSEHLSNYSRKNTISGVLEMGLVSYSSSISYIMFQHGTSNRYIAVQSADGLISAIPTTGAGLTISNRRNSTNVQRYLNNSKLEIALSSTGVGNQNYFMSYLPGYGYYGTCEIAFGSIGSGLTDGEASTFYTLVQNLQIALTRNV